MFIFFFFFSSRRRHTRCLSDWSSDVCSSDLAAPEVYRRAGAEVHVIGGEPDGWNINDGIGSTHLGPLIEAVARHGADIGIAHDGDADRCLAVTAAGDVVDGDMILAICALAMHERGSLKDATVVA